jgi:hypothetical protein
VNPSLILALQIINLISALEPSVLAIINELRASGKTVEQYIAEEQARDAATIAAADAEIAAAQAAKDAAR